MRLPGKTAVSQTSRRGPRRDLKGPTSDLELEPLGAQYAGSHLASDAPSGTTVG
jgi:hypothetical protein